MRFGTEDEMKKVYKVVRRDFCVTVPGDIVHADEETGKFRLAAKNYEGNLEEKDYDLGPDGIRLVHR